VNKTGITLLAIVVLTGPGAGAVGSQAPDKLTAALSRQPSSAANVTAEVFAWLDQRGVNERVRAEAEALWSDRPPYPAETDLLWRLARTFALADENARELVRLCSGPRRQLVPPSQPWLTDPKTPPFMANNLRLLYGRWLAQESLFDESLEQLSGLRPQDVVDPASLLFYQAVVYHRLLDRQSGLEAIKGLLGGDEPPPRRYAAVARLMQADLEGLQEDTLDHIARRMDDIHRRLGLGRAGQKVRKIEDGVIESLDKLIKKIEDEQQQASAAGSNVPSGTPAQDSRILGGKGPGDVTKRDIGGGSGWGDLPPKQRQEAMQQIGREFPSHYRDVIEQYFRKLAGEGERRE